MASYGAGVGICYESYFATFLGQISVLILSHVISSSEHKARARSSCGVCEVLPRPEKKAETNKQVSPSPSSSFLTCLFQCRDNYTCPEIWSGNSLYVILCFPC